MLTAWSVQGHSSATSTFELKVVRETAANTFNVVAHDPELRTVEPGAVNTFSIRVPVSGGELLALWVPDGNHYCNFRSGNSGDAQVFKSGSHPEPEVSDTFVTDATSVEHRTNVSATLEADADDDGYGDESQDDCPQDASAQGACPDTDGDGVANFEDDCPTVAGLASSNGCPDTDPPETTITKDPKDKGSKNRVRYEFVSDEEGSTFECKIDKKPFKPCTSPRRFKVEDGKHKFKVRATDPAGNTDPTVDKDKFKVTD